MPPERDGISGDLPDFFSANGAVRAAKGTEEGNKSHEGLT